MKLDLEYTKKIIDALQDWGDVYMPISAFSEYELDILIYYIKRNHIDMIVQ